MKAQLHSCVVWHGSGCRLLQTALDMGHWAPGVMDTSVLVWLGGVSGCSSGAPDIVASCSAACKHTVVCSRFSSRQYCQGRRWLLLLSHEILSENHQEISC